MEPRVGETIVGEVIFFAADRAYRECTFENCTIVIDVSGAPSDGDAGDL